MEPIPARDVNEVRFDDTVDVVVVGLGVAGACATVAAREAGADVLAVERATTSGGTSANSGGLIYLGGGTALQIACGYEDSVENMAAFLRSSLGPGVDDERLDCLLRGLGGALRLAGLSRRSLPGRVLRRTEPGVGRRLGAPVQRGRGLVPL